MTTVGILGGGQLARMLALSGAPLGLRFLVMDTAPDACAGQYVPMLVGDYRDETMLAHGDAKIAAALAAFRQRQTEDVAGNDDPRTPAIAPQAQGTDHQA